MDNTKSSEIQKTDQSQQPQYCKADCGFFGSSDKQGYCSVCFSNLFVISVYLFDFDTAQGGAIDFY